MLLIFEVYNKMETRTIQIGNKQLKEIYDSNIANALEGAQKKCKRVFYMPELLDARIDAPKDSRLWQNWYSTPSLRVTGKTKQGTSVVAYVHKANYFSNPENIRSVQAVNGARVMPRKEFYKILANEGKDVFVIDYNALKNSPSGVILVENAIKYTQTIPFCGSEERAEKYLSKHLEVYGNQIGVWHCDDLADEPLARPLHVGDIYVSGLGGNYLFCISGRFVGVMSGAEGTRKKISAPQEKQVIVPTLEQIVALGKRFVCEDSRKEFEKEAGKLYQK